MKTYVLFTESKDKIQAINFVKIYLAEKLNKGVCKEYVVTGNCIKLCDISVEYIQNRLRIVEDELSYHRKREEKCRSNNDRRYEGRAAYVISKILRETFCKDMPWFNLIDNNWSIPAVDNEKFLPPGSGYYAVEVDLEFMPDYPINQKEKENILREIKPLT